MELNTELLGGLLEKDEYSRRVVRVLSWEQEPGAQKGDNYLSEVTRVRMRVLLGSGLTTTKSILIKHSPAAHFPAEAIKQFSPFVTEIMMYRDVLPQMEILLKDLGEEPFWAHCLGFKPNDELYLEDLKELGYYMANRQEALDFDHAEIVVKHLAKFHALSLVLLDKQIIIPHYFKECIMVNSNIDIMNTLYDNTLISLISILRNNWGPKWHDAASRIDQLRKNLVSIKKKIWEADVKSTSLKVLNHGDCWANNIMFKYKEGTNIPEALKFVDFQTGNCGSYAWDLTYLLHVSLQPEVRWERLDELLAIYQSSLESMMSRLGLHGAPILSEVKKEMEKLLIVGFLCCSINLPIITAPGHADLDKFSGTPEDLKGEEWRFLIPRIQYFLKKDIKSFIDRGIL